MTTIEQGSLFETFDGLRRGGLIDEKGLDPEILDQLTPDEWEALGGYLGAMNSALRFAIGDWINWGEGAVGDRYDQAQHMLGLSFSTVRSWSSVAMLIARVRRRTPEVSWSHHEAIATLPPREQRKWLARIEREGWTVEETRAARRAEDPDDGEPVAPDGSEALSAREAARRVWLSSRRDGDAFRVPVEPMLALARTIGEPV